MRPQVKQVPSPLKSQTRSIGRIATWLFDDWQKRELAMQCPTCDVRMTLLAEPPSAHGFEFTLYGCPKCERRVMACFCVASGESGIEAVTAEDAAMIVKTDPPELKAFMKAWQERVIGW